MFSLFSGDVISADRYPSKFFPFKLEIPYPLQFILAAFH